MTHRTRRGTRVLSISMAAGLALSAGACSIGQRDDAPPPIAAQTPPGGNGPQAEWMARNRPQTTGQSTSQTDGATDRASTSADESEPGTAQSDGSGSSGSRTNGSETAALEVSDRGTDRASRDPMNEPDRSDGAMRVVDERGGSSRAGETGNGSGAALDAAPVSPEQRRLDKALELYTSGDLEAALAELERAIANNPRFTRAYIEMSDILVELSDYERAERVLREAVRNEPRNYMAQYRHASVLSALDRPADARRAYLRALSVRPGAYDANLGLSRVLLEQGEPQQALPYAQRAVRADPGASLARMHLGNVLASTDRHEEAVVEYQQAADSPSGPDADVLLNLSDSLNQLERYAEMVAALEQLVLLAPTATAYERLGSGYFRLRRYDESLAAFEDAARLDPAYYPAHNGIAVAELNNYLWSGKSDGAARRRAVEAMRTSLRIARDQPRIVQLLDRYGRPSQAEGDSGRR